MALCTESSDVAGVCQVAYDQDTAVCLIPDDVITIPVEPVEDEDDLIDEAEWTFRAWSNDISKQGILKSDWTFRSYKSTSASLLVVDIASSTGWSFRSRSNFLTDVGVVDASTSDGWTFSTGTT